MIPYVKRLDELGTSDRLYISRSKQAACWVQLGPGLLVLGKIASLIVRLPRLIPVAAVRSRSSRSRPRYLRQSACRPYGKPPHALLQGAGEASQRLAAGS